MKFAKNIALSFFMLLLSACSQTVKTVQWEEEVPLNTGETIWVKRLDTFVKGPEPGNPLKRTWGLEKRDYVFAWQGQKYAYVVKTKTGGPVLIHVLLADNTIAIVDSAWPYCAGYGEFRWIDGYWQLQKNVSPTIIGQRRNLMGSFDAAGEIPARVDTAFKHQIDTSVNSSQKIMQIEEAHLATNCPRKKYL